MEDKKQLTKSTPVASRVLDDGTLIELIFDPVARTTRLAVSSKTGCVIEETVALGDEILRPFSPDNNLIKHEAVLLPSEPKAYESETELRRSITNFVHRYVDLTPGFERIVVEYVLLTWVYDAFNELPYLRLQGDFGTGKTRALLVLGSIARCPFFASGASTVSPIFHTLDAFRGTLIFDEADFRMSDEKAELVKILNNGTVRGIPVLRTLINQKHEFNPAAFHVFGPKIVATRGNYDDKALESRFLTELIGGRPLREDIPINLPASFRGEALLLRNQLLTYRFRRFHGVRLDASLVDRSLEPRQNQVLVPLLSIAEDNETRDFMRESVRSTGQSLLAERSVSVEAELLAVLLSLFDEYKESSIPIKLVHKEFADLHGSEFERPITTRYLASILRRKLSIRIMKSMGVMAIPRSEELRIREIGRRFGLDNAIVPMSRDLGRKGDTGESMLPVSTMN